ncbi:MAG TPA: tetratricopeptide repeat-containing diguanylate cyclase [Thermoanaerobaculia bacterium]|jgi:diguanylate cyclase (GGDEF)-like protein
MPPTLLRLALAALLAAPLAAEADEKAAQGCIALAISDPNAAIARAGAALPKTTAPRARTELLVCRGYAHEQIGNVNEAMRDYEAAVKSAEQTPDDVAYADALALRGELRSYRGEFDAAMEDLQKSYAVSVRLRNERKQLHALNAIANLYADRRVGAYDKAIEYYRQVLPFHEKANRLDEVANTYYNIAATLDTKGDSAAALPEYQRALALERRRGDPAAIADVQRGLGIVLGKLGRNEEALAVLDEALATYLKHRDLESIAHVRLARGTVLRKLGRTAEAVRELEAARVRLESTKSYRFLEKAHDERAQVYAAMGNWRAAHDARAAQMAVREQLAERLRAEQVSRMRVQFDSERKEQENRALVRENESATRIRNLQAVAIVLGAALIAFLVAMARRMRRLALTDELTRLPNRRNVLAYADDQLRAARTGGRGFSMLALDIDHFKRINDTYGHDAGDVVLRRVAETCRAALRRHDRIGRTGGEEFLVVLPDASAATAAEVAERLRAAVEQTDFSDVAPGLRITISIGATEWSASDDFTAIVRRADDSLYRAKEGGRNRVERATA